MNKGLIYFKDLFNYETGIFKSNLDLQDQNININYFDYMCFMLSIPKEIKEQIKNYTDNLNTTFGAIVSDICNNKQQICRYSYNKLVKMLPHDIKCKQK
jgi:hypothetical protein